MPAYEVTIEEVGSGEGPMVLNVMEGDSMVLFNYGNIEWDIGPGVADKHRIASLTEQLRRCRKMLDEQVTLWALFDKWGRRWLGWL